MPVESGGTLRIQLCNGYGPATTMIDLGSKVPGDGHDKSSGHPCSFAGGFAGSVLPPMAHRIVAPPKMAIDLAGGRAIAGLTIHRLAAPPPPAIGPPLTL